ncbi:MAG TPA: S8 family serine peptidase, partial [Usitatibacter sp.]|nr:S8 family serine peptidase [Usitatibacter sp.]
MLYGTNSKRRDVMGNTLGRLGAAILAIALAFAGSPSFAQSTASNGLGNGASGSNLGSALQNLAAQNSSRISQILGRAGRGGNRADDGNNKISADLAQAMAGRFNSNQKWLTRSSKGNLMDVLILANAGADTRLNGLRLALTAGGGVYGRNFRSVPGLSARLPQALITKLAQRADVWRIVPNRTVMQANSSLEMLTGADDVRTLAAQGAALDGSGVTIAVVDSGIMTTHGAFIGNDGSSRVKVSVDFTAPNATPDSPVNSSGYTFQDPYGHGTLVASVAAGRTVGDASTDSTGVAPGASLVDVRVLDNNGLGTIATTLAGIDWVVNNASTYNIKVMNVSLGTTSTDSYLTDPLCIAVRNAVAAGITVVVAAGNYGVGAIGNPEYGTISSPGDEPSVITVGSANTHDTSVRGNDT